MGLAIFVSLATGRTNQLLATLSQPPEALTLGFERGLVGASIALVIAAVIALLSPNVRVVDMAPDADDNPVAGASTPEAPTTSAGLPRARSKTWSATPDALSRSLGTS